MKKVSMNKALNLDNDITVIDAVYSAKGIVSMYLLRAEGSIAIIDTGTKNSVPYVQSALEQQGLSFDDVHYIIPTHVHLDHAAGAGVLMALCKKAHLVIHPRGARHMIDPSKLIAGTVAVYGQDRFDALYGSISPVDKSRVIEADDGFILNFNNRELLFIDTPGHARHHFCVWDKKSSTFFSGDAFGVSYKEFDNSETNDVFIFPTTTPTQFDPQVMKNSIDKLMGYQPKQICLTHFSVIKPTQKIVQQLKDGIDYFSENAKKYYTHENAKDKLYQCIKIYLLKQLKIHNPKLDMDFCAQKLDNDIELNTQGLLYWQQSMAKKNLKT